MISRGYEYDRNHQRFAREQHIQGEWEVSPRMPTPWVTLMSRAGATLLLLGGILLLMRL